MSIRRPETITWRFALYELRSTTDFACGVAVPWLLRQEEGATFYIISTHCARQAGAGIGAPK
jgi:hypothetical protein